MVRCTDIYKVVIDWGKGKRESTDEGCRRDGRSERVWKGTGGYRRVRCGNGTDTGSSALCDSVFNVNIPPCKRFFRPYN